MKGQKLIIFLTLLIIAVSMAAQTTITGHVYDESGLGIPGGGSSTNLRVFIVGVIVSFRVTFFIFTLEYFYWPNKVLTSKTYCHA